MHHVPEWIPVIASCVSLAAAVVRLITVRLQHRGATPVPEADGPSRPGPESSAGREGRPTLRR